LSLSPLFRSPFPCGEIFLSVPVVPLCMTLFFAGRWIGQGPRVDCFSPPAGSLASPPPTLFVPFEGGHCSLYQSTKKTCPLCESYLFFAPLILFRALVLSTRFQWNGGADWSPPFPVAILDPPPAPTTIVVLVLEGTTGGFFCVNSRLLFLFFFCFQNVGHLLFFPSSSPTPLCCFFRFQPTMREKSFGVLFSPPTHVGAVFVVLFEYPSPCFLHALQEAAPLLDDEISRIGRLVFFFISSCFSI